MILKCDFKQCMRCDKYWHDCKYYEGNLIEDWRLYCPHCNSCQECGCCPCNKPRCDWCGEV